MAVIAWLAASLGAAPMGLFAEPQTPPPLPPDTVDQLGLSWDLKLIGREGATKPFRFSLCELRYLTPGEVSGPCNHPRNVNGGHDAPYTFSAGHGTFLPKGLSIDGNGVLEGNDPGLLSKAAKLPLCVRQLDVERCKDVQLGPGKTETEADNIAKALGTGAGAPKAGAGAGKAILVVGGLGLAVGGVIVAANALKTMNAASCVTAADLAASAPGYLTTSGPNTACTTYTSCGRGIGMAVCVDLTCDVAKYYYRTSDGRQFQCGSVPAGSTFTFNSSFCNAAATAVINYCFGL